MPFDLAESFLLAAERELGASLPKTYRLAMLRENGGEIETDDDFWQQYPVADTSDRKRLSRSANHILKETESCRGWARFPENAVAIASNGAGDQLVLLRQNEVFAPEVYAWLHESGELKKVADDFSLIKAS
jgi:hypothetical protein